MTASHGSSPSASSRLFWLGAQPVACRTHGCRRDFINKSIHRFSGRLTKRSCKQPSWPFSASLSWLRIYLYPNETTDCQPILRSSSTPLISDEAMLDNAWMPNSHRGWPFPVGWLDWLAPLMSRDPSTPNAELPADSFRA